MLKKNFELGGGMGPEIGNDALSKDDMDAVLARADLRRLGYGFRAKLIDFSARAEVAPEEKVQQQKALDKVMKEASGEAALTEEEAEKILQNKKIIIAKADEMIDSAPSYAQLSYGWIAKAEQSAGEDFGDSLRLAQEVKASAKNETAEKISDFMPDAVLLGILQRQIRGQELPDIKILAETAATDQKLLRACALALPEGAREDFLNYLPEEIRITARNIMDRELSKVLGRDMVTETEKMEREAVKVRLSENLKSALAQENDIGHSLLLEIIDSLGNLGGEDSKRLLLEIGLASLKREKDPIKSLAKNAQLARLIKKLFEIDEKMGGNLAMKFLARQEVPDSLFIFIASKLIKEGYLAASATDYLKTAENIPWLRRLIAEYPNQFNTVIETISKLPDYRPAENQEEIFAAIDDLGSLTPIIFSRYHEAGQEGRRDLSRKIKELKPRFFRNEPIAKILPKQDRDILVEMVYLAYKPVGMSFKDVGKLINELKDQTDDLAGYKFPADGYDFTLANERKYEIKPGEKMDWQKASIWRDMFDGSKLREWEDEEKAARRQKRKTSEAEEMVELSEAEKIMTVLVAAAKGKNEFSSLEIGRLLKPVAETEMVQEFLRRYPKVDKENIFIFLSEVQEIVGVFFKDNFKPELEKFLSQPENQAGLAELAGILAGPKRQQTLEKLMAGKLQVDWQTIGEPEELAGVLSQYIEEKIVSPWRAEIKRDKKKFQTKGGGSAVSARNGLKAYISKNIGSFFAKASAGICTAQDVGLFNRDDHFHINIVEKDENVRGNIQAYIIKDGAGRSLVLRGFNPNSEFLKNIDVEIFCEKVLDIGQQFVRNNGLKNLYIAEQDGGWHSLSNRTEVFNYLKRYLKERTAKSHSLKVSSSHSISTIYQVG